MIEEYEKLLIKAIDFCKNYQNIFGFNILALAYKNTGNIDKQELHEKLVAANPTETSIYTNAGNYFIH